MWSAVIGVRDGVAMIRAWGYGAEVPPHPEREAAERRVREHEARALATADPYETTRQWSKSPPIARQPHPRRDAPEAP